MNETKGSKQVSKKPVTFWKLLGIMGIVSIAIVIGILPTFGMSLFFGGTVGALVWMNYEKPQKEMVMKKGALAGAITGVILGILNGIILLLVPTSKGNAIEWIVMISIIVVCMALFSTLTGLLGGYIYKSRTFEKPAVQPLATEISRQTVKQAVTQGIIDITDISEGEIFPLPADLYEWDKPIVEILSKKDNNFKVVILRHELDVTLIDSILRINSKLYKSGVTAIGYGTNDKENDTFMQKANPIVLVPKNVVYHRPLNFYMPAGLSNIKFLILRQDTQTVRIIERPISYQQFQLRVIME